MQQFAAVSSMARPKESLAEVIKQLSGGQDPNRVLCCGHSLGGALATLGGPCHTVLQTSHSDWQYIALLALALLALAECCCMAGSL